MDTFTRAYMIAALWSSTMDDDTPMDRDYGIDDIAPETREKMIADCRKFQSINRIDLIKAANLGDYANREYSPDERAGHDFWLTRNGHGAGFWDRGLGKVGERLTEAAKAYGSVDLYVGDDGRIYA